MKSVKFRTEELLDLFFQNEIKNYERFDFLYNKKRYSFLLNKIIEQIGEKSEKKIKILDVGGGCCIYRQFCHLLVYKLQPSIQKKVFLPRIQPEVKPK